MMHDITNMPILSTTASELGQSIRDTRKKLGFSQAWLADQIGCRRQTIGDLEAGRNVELYTLMHVLTALGKGLMIADARPDIDSIGALFNHGE
jgi:DNA-binding XRE family transcriptional regulator